MAVNQKSELRNYLIELCEKVALFIREELDKVSASDIEEKELNSLVSYVDKQAENMIVTALRKVTPDAGFITEEDTKDEISKPQTWIVDPLDGTTNFLRKIPHFSISIALMEGEEITLGIVYEVMLDVAYTAIKGIGAWENDKPIRVSATKELSNAIVVTGFPYRKNLNMEASFAVLRFCVLNCRGVRRLGSAALDLAYVATGKIDVYYENSLNIWDIAAGILLVQEAGGRVVDYQCGKNYLKTGSIISSNGLLHQNIEQAIIEQNFSV